MARRRFRSRGTRSRSARKIRWLSQAWTLDTILDADPVGGGEWVSFWAKDPASRETRATFAQDVAVKEPVDETLVRMHSAFVGQILVPGTAGQAPLVTVTHGVIPFNGGNKPEFYDFAIFDSSSLIAPPSPLFDGDDPWVWMNWSSNGGAESKGEATGTGYERVEWVKSMRKLPAGVGLLHVVHALAINEIGGSPIDTTIRYCGNHRMAMKSGFAL